jgi:antitoxin component YwqK of YwqJK toxin-antitoxin module
MKPKHFSHYILLSFALISLGTQSCSAGRGSNPVDNKLKTISLIDRNGITETVTNPERIKQYQSVNFLNPQPYERVIRIHKRDKSGNIPSYLHSYHENGQIKQYVEVLNSRALGVYKEWHANGAQRLQAWVIGGEADLSENSVKSWIFDGHAYAWDEEGKLVADISYLKGKQHGCALYYHPNGCLWKKLPYSDNCIDGTIEVYLDDGQLFQKLEYQKGMLQGTSFKYWPGCRIAFEEEYQDNHLMTGRYYDKQGNIVSEINQGQGFRAIFGKTELAELHEFRNGAPEGEVKVFGTDKKLLRRFFVKNNQKHGEETDYYEIPHLRHIPKIVVTWYEGKIQGITKTWYDNGVQESSREMSNNARNGIATAWYRNGNLMLIEEYEQDKLIKGEYFRMGDKQSISSIKEGSGTATLFDPEGNYLRKIFYESGIPSGTT